MIVRAAGAISTVKLALALAPVESVTVTETVNLPALVGVPVSEAPPSCTPGGSPLPVKLYGGVPPVAPNCAEYTAPT